MAFVSRAVAAVGGFRRKNVLTMLFAWNAIVFFAFVFIHRFYGLKHIDLGELKPSWHLAFYFTAITHFSFTPPGEFAAKDSTGRALVALHSTLSWIPLFWVVFAPGGGDGNAANNLPPNLMANPGAYW